MGIAGLVRPDGERDLLWISRPDARHSRNLDARPELSIVIFDSQVVPGEAAALYLSATATQSDDGIEVFSARSVAQGLGVFTAEDVTGAGRFRLYRARVRERWVLGSGDRRVEVPFAR